ncbi:MAG: hypothetical protein ACYC5X_00100 [Syntrophales bacterium]
MKSRMIENIGVPDKNDADTGNGAAQIYEQRLCAFVDILGFSDLVERSKRSNALQQKIRELLRRVIDAKPLRDSWWIDIIEARLREHGIPNPRSAAEQQVAGYAAAERGTNFSDNIVLSVTLDAHAISTLITSLIFLSRDAAELGIYVRGGICQDLLCHEENLCFGPALIAAYKLEQKVAFYPRILVTPEAYEAIAKVDMDDVDPLASYVKTDFDGERFLHFLNPQFMKQSKSTALEGQTGEIYRQLSNWLSLVHPGDLLWPKYEWLALYFNSVLEESHVSGMESFSIES